MAPAPRLYTAGWFRTGATGAIPQCRADAKTLAARILSELTPEPARPGAKLFEHLPGITRYADWERIDAQERGNAPADRCRRKFPLTADLLRACNLQDA